MLLTTVSRLASRPCLISPSQLSRLQTVSRLTFRRFTQTTADCGQSSRSVGYWLAGCAGMVWGAVAIGGVTRLTESGLSMVQWDLIRTMRPPLNEADWEREFEKYKQFPEYRHKSRASEMTLSEFKFIWTMEYAHRMWGRAIGLVFLLPAVYFWSRGRLSPRMKRIVGAGGVLIGVQGGVGWWMVKSGLDPSANSDGGAVPRVSHYRLATHLSLAVILYQLLASNALTLLSPVPSPVSKGVGAVRKLRALAVASRHSALTTIVIGALVAGLDAGLVYNSWPKWADRWVPEDLWLERFGWRNLTENPTTVQFAHRSVAYLAVGLATSTWIFARRVPLPPNVKLASHLVLAAVLAQATLGVLTLINHVPVPLAASHQNGSMVLLTALIWLQHTIKAIPK